jgi:hypothetical protein
MLAGHLVDLAMADVVRSKEPLNHAAILRLGLRCYPQKVWATEVIAHQLIERASATATSDPNLGWLVVEGLLIGGNEL